MKLIIARHAQTDDNVSEIISGGSPREVILNDEGIIQAQKLAGRLKEEGILYAYVSPQKRAVQTASEILKHHPSAKIIPSPKIMEKSSGIYEGLGKNILKEVRMKSKDLFHLFRPEKGESYSDVQERVKIFFQELFDRHENDTILVVSHAGTIGMLLLYLFDEPITEENYKKYRPDNTAITVIEVYKDKRKKIHVLNDVSHLK